MGSLPNAEHSQCLPIPEVYLEPDSGWAIGAMSFSAVGILLTCTVNILSLNYVIVNYYLQTFFFNQIRYWEYF